MITVAIIAECEYEREAYKRTLNGETAIENEIKQERQKTASFSTLIPYQIRKKAKEEELI